MSCSEICIHTDDYDEDCSNLVNDIDIPVNDFPFESGTFIS